MFERNRWIFFSGTAGYFSADLQLFVDKVHRLHVCLFLDVIFADFCSTLSLCRLLGCASTQSAGFGTNVDSNAVSIVESWGVVRVRRGLAYSWFYMSRKGHDIDDWSCIGLWVCCGPAGAVTPVTPEGS